MPVSLSTSIRSTLHQHHTNPSIVLYTHFPIPAFFSPSRNTRLFTPVPSPKSLSLPLVLPSPLILPLPFPLHFPLVPLYTMLPSHPHIHPSPLRSPTRGLTSTALLQYSLRWLCRSITSAAARYLWRSARKRMTVLKSLSEGWISGSARQNSRPYLPPAARCTNAARLWLTAKNNCQKREGKNSLNIRPDVEKFFSLYIRRWSAKPIFKKTWILFYFWRQEKYI